MAHSVPNKAHQPLTELPSGHSIHGASDGSKTKMSHFFGSPSSADDNPFSLFGSDGPMVMKSPGQQQVSKSEMSLNRTALEKSSQQQQQSINAPSLSPKAPQAATVAPPFIPNTAGLFDGSAEVATTDNLFSSLHLQSAPLAPPPFSHAPPLEQPTPQFPAIDQAVNPATGAASGIMQLDEPASLVQPLLLDTSCSSAVHLPQRSLALPAQREDTGMMGGASNGLLIDNDVRRDDFTHSLPSQPSAVSSIQGHTPTSLSSSNPPTSMVLTTNLPGSLHKRNTSFTDVTMLDPQPHLPAEFEASSEIAEVTGRPSQSPLNQTLCSLLGSQENLSVKNSPVQLMAPAPYMFEGHTSTSFVGEISMESSNEVTQLGPATLPSSVNVARHQHGAVAHTDSPCIHSWSDSMNTSPSPHRSIASSQRVDQPKDTQETVVTHYSPVSANREESNVATVSSRELVQHSSALLHEDGCSGTDVARAAALVSRSATVAPVVYSKGTSSSENCDAVEKAGSSTTGFASDAPSVMPPVFSGVLTTSSDHCGLSSSILPCSTGQSLAQVTPCVSQPSPHQLEALPAVLIPPQGRLSPHMSLPTAMSVSSSQEAAPGVMSSTRVPSRYPTRNEASIGSKVVSEDIGSLTNTDISPIPDGRNLPQESVKNEPISSHMEKDVRSIQARRQDEVPVGPTAGVADGHHDPMYDTSARGGGDYVYGDRYRPAYPDPVYHSEPHHWAGYEASHMRQPPQKTMATEPTSSHMERNAISLQTRQDEAHVRPAAGVVDSYAPTYHHDYPMYDARGGEGAYAYHERYRSAYSDAMYHPRPHLGAEYGVPDHYRYQVHPPPHHNYYGGYYPGQHGYDSLYSDPYMHPPDPYYNHYGVPQQQTYQGYQQEPHLGYISEQSSNPPLWNGTEPTEELPWDGTQPPVEASSLTQPPYYSDEATKYTEGSYPQIAADYPGNSHNQSMESKEVKEIWEPILSTPISPVRKTPEHFYCPHRRVAFGFGGKLVTVLPIDIRATEKRACVEIRSMRDLLVDEESVRFVEAMNDTCFPFIPGETPKNVVLHFASDKARQCREEREVLLSDENQDSNNADCADILDDEALLWEFLALLCQQNGVILPSDVADILKGSSLSIKPSVMRDEQECVDELRQLLLSGRKKNALDYACSKALWGHALMLASRMDEQSRTYVVNRFTASLASTDPLSTFYTLLLGRLPAAVKQDGLSRAGDWKPHLSMILANKCSKLDSTAIIFMGDTLMAKGRCCAAHLCYYLADVRWGCYGDASTKYSLLGVEQSVIHRVGRYPQPHELWKMETLEYAMALTKNDFSLPSFQVFKLLHVLKLIEYGFLSFAMKYCEQISCCLLKGIDKYTPTVLSTLLDVAVRLHHFTREFGMEESELPSWLHQLERSITAILLTDCAPNLMSPSPLFSSVSQTYSSNDARPQLTIGLQPQYGIPNALGTRTSGMLEGTGEQLIAEKNREQHRTEKVGEQLYAERSGEEHYTERSGEEHYAERSGEPLYAEKSQEQIYTEKNEEHLYEERSGEHLYKENVGEQHYGYSNGEQPYKERNKEQLYEERNKEQLFGEQPGELMSALNPQELHPQVQDRGGMTSYFYGGPSVSGDVGVHSTGEGEMMAAEERTTLQKEQYGSPQPGQNGE